MKTEEVKRTTFVQILNGLTILSAKGNIDDFTEWLKIEEYRLKLEEIKEKEAKIYKSIMEKTGYADYAKKAEDLHLRNVKKYTHSDKDLHAIKQFKEQIEEFNNSNITIPFFRISKSLLLELPTEALSCRIDLLPIIELNESPTPIKTRK